MKTRKACGKRAVWLWMAMPLFFLSCEKEIDGGGTAQIRIEITDVPYGPDAVRNAGKPKSETIVIPLTGVDDMYLSATLKEEDSELKAFTQGARLRIAVYDVGGTCVKEGIGTFAASTFTLDSPTALDGLTTGISYTFVAFSLNSTTEDPNIYRVGEALEDIDPAKDLLYGKSVPTLISAGNNSVLIPLSHKFSQVTVVADATAISSANITEISAELIPSYTADVQLIGASAGVLSPGASPVAQAFTFPSNPNAPVVLSEPRTVFVNGANPVKVKLGPVKFNGNISYANEDEASFTFPLSLGTRYTLTLSFKGIIYRWAGSNVYWDTDHLTFDPIDETDHALYQGVYFKFGSLVGISGSEAMNVSTTTMYVPNYNSSNPETSSWRASTITAEGWSTWFGIPYISSLSGLGNHPLFLYENSDPTHYGNKLGDICRYIGDTGAGPKGYRMPTYDEFNVNPDDWGAGGTWSFWITDSYANQAWSAGSPSGTGLISYYRYWKANNNIKFPASGWRCSWFSPPGQLFDELNRYGYYRGSSIGESTEGFGIGDAYWSYDEWNGFYRVMEGFMLLVDDGLSVRCIKKLPTE
jgi:hypothetical protein